MVDSTFNDQELGNSTQRDIKTLRSVKDCACVKRTIVCALVLFVTGVMVLLTASFLIVKKIKVPSYGDTSYSNLSAGCSNYTYLTCREELRLIQSFLLGVESNENATLAIASDVDQENNENTAMLIQYSLNYVKGTRECKSTILSFMCLYLFPLCDANGTIHMPSTEDCHEITGTCKEEFEAMMDLPGIKGQLNLPDCQSLLNSSSIFSVGINASIWKNDLSVSQFSTANQINCSARFFLSNGSCLPRCDRWSQYSDHARTTIEIVELASSITVIVLGSTILAVSCFDCSRMYAFPSVLILHFIMFLVLDAATTAISFIDRGTLFCSSLSLLDALKKPTAFCSVIQSLHIYFTFEISIWWFSHVVILFWQITFPFHARMSKVNGQNKYIYGGILITSLIVPAISLVAVIEIGGYKIWKFDPSHCVQKNADVAFLAVVLPLNMFTILGAPLMILIIISLIKHRRSKQDHTNTIITADRKILFGLFYFLLLSAVSTTFGSVGAKSDDQFASNIYKYFQCESMGQGLCDAEKSAYEDISLTFTLTDIVYHVLFGTIPFVTLGIVIPVSWIKRLSSKTTRKKS